MGIPKFFRWLTRRYPMILQNVKQEEDIPEIDNFYMDLNSIVHNCIHGNDPKRHERISKSKNFEELWQALMEAIDQLVHSVKPKQVLYLAIDGVAPRAKMNQQRARRFRSAQDAETLREQLKAQGREAHKLFDKNAISPGTPFMMELCRELAYFVKHKLSMDPLYQKLKIVVSDGQVPGEGEHKMLDFIRQLRLDKNYDPNTRHCFYGADADLIMLSLLTHEPHFTIIREEHIVKKQKNGGVQRIELTHTDNYQLIHVSLLREYLELEYASVAPKMKIKFDLERIIDDFVFFCFFIGNDFLPSISCLDIAEGSLDKLVEYYKNTLPLMEQYITDHGTINWKVAQPFIWLLAEHEHMTWRDRIDQIQDKFGSKNRTIVVNDLTAQMAGQAVGDNRTLTINNAYKSQIYQKKCDKVNTLKIKGETKKYKKNLIGKLFKEDVAQLTEARKVEYDFAWAKYSQVVSAKQKQEESKSADQLTPQSIWEQLDEGDLSDLRPDEIPDRALSDVDALLLDESLEGTTTQQANKMDNIAKMQGQLDQDAEVRNLKFMQTFVSMYSEDPKKAKQFYYSTKVNIDCDTPDGQKALPQMFRKYIEGLQWVLYYYYKGAPHWRWYYPYHYAPMMQDIGHDICQTLLDGKETVEEFQIDFNCPQDKRPYTPFQQLLCILPTHSFELLPKDYLALAEGELSEFFPSHFDVDLNGKTLAWEAIVLIPFCDEEVFLNAEKKMLESEVEFSDVDKNRNIAAFQTYRYSFDPKSKGDKVLESTLASFKCEMVDKTKSEVLHDYESVGHHVFDSKLLPGAKHPSPGYPSFKYLGIKELEIDYKTIQKVRFEIFCAKIPQVEEETQPELLEEFLNKLVKKSKKDIYCGFPYQYEAFPVYFEDRFSIYTIFGDFTSGIFTVQRSDQFRTADEWTSHVNRLLGNLWDQGLFCPKSTVNVLVTCNRVEKCQFDHESGYYNKIYRDKPDVLPLSLVMRRVDPNHPKSCLDVRCSEFPDREIQTGCEAICMNLNQFGLLGKVTRVNQKQNNVILAIDKEREESKVHDPYLGQKRIQDMHSEKDKKTESLQGDEVEGQESNDSLAFYTDKALEMQLKLKFGVISRITSSFLIQYKNPENGDKMVVDLGLNVKNYSKKLHVPNLVRFVTSKGDEGGAAQEHDQWKHDNHGRGANRARQQWEYSSHCADIIKQYYEKFPEVFAAVKKCGQPGSGAAVNKLKDVYGNDQAESVNKLKEVLKWIEGLDISQLPYVEMGFDALDTEMIDQIKLQTERVKSEYEKVKLNVNEKETISSFQIFTERFPFWCSPTREQDAASFKMGHRVINLNSQQRKYVPFGARGTVVGRTQDRVIVMFDEQFIGGSNIFGLCENYRGAMVLPNNLLNLTLKFDWIKRKKMPNSNQLLDMFTEKSQDEVANQEESKEEQKPKRGPNPNNKRKDLAKYPSAGGENQQQQQVRQVYQVKEQQSEGNASKNEEEVVPQINFKPIPQQLKSNKDFMEVFGDDEESKK